MSEVARDYVTNVFWMCERIGLLELKIFSRALEIHEMTKRADLLTMTPDIHSQGHHILPERKDV